MMRTHKSVNGRGAWRTVVLVADCRVALVVACLCCAPQSAYIGAIAVADLVKTTLGPKGMDKILQSMGGPGTGAWTTAFRAPLVALVRLRRAVLCSLLTRFFCFCFLCSSSSCVIQVAVCPSRTTVPRS
jgi:hypothetical protein